MSTRKERKNRWWLRCPNCGAWKVAHFVPPGSGTSGFFICKKK